MRAAKVQASLRIRAVSPEPPLLAHTSSESRGTFRQKARSLAPLNGWASAVKICHDGMLEDTNSLDAVQIFPFRFSGFIKDVTGSYDLMFYLGVASSSYITMATVIVVIIKKCCILSKAYKSPKIEYSKLDDPEHERADTDEQGAETGLLNGYAKGMSVTDTSEVDNVAFDSSAEEQDGDNPFDIDTASIVVHYNSNGKGLKDLFSKTL